MNLGYDSQTESLYIGVADGISAECVELYDGVVLDFDSGGALIGVDIHRVGSLPQELEIPERIPTPAGASGALASGND